jgi:hypothetical protein
VDVSHEIPGRIRYRIPVLIEKPEVADFLVTNLPKLPEVLSVTADIRSGSLVVMGTELMDGGFILAAIVRLAGLEDAVESRPQTKLVSQVLEGWKTLDNSIYDMSNGMLGIKETGSLVLALLFIRKVIQEGKLSTPPSLTLLWWALALLIGEKKK